MLVLWLKSVLINYRKACKGTGIPRVNLRAWAEIQTGPQQLSASLASVMPEFSNDLNSPDLDSEQEQLEFQQYLQVSQFLSSKFHH